MQKIVKVSILVIYILFSKVYPSVHWHAQENHYDLELSLSVHSQEVLVNNLDHDDHQEQTDGHNHEDSHFVGDWAYTFQAKTITAKIAAKAIKGIKLSDPKLQVQDRIQKYVPLKISSHCLSSISPDRAPPFIL